MAVPVAAQSATAAAPVTSQSSPDDSGKLATARAIVALAMPPGYFRAVMGKRTDAMIRDLRDRPLMQMLAQSGIAADKAGKVPADKLMQAAEIVDPAYQRRTELTMKVTMAGVADVMATIEPEMREAMAAAYAHNFDDTQLADILRFFNTPSGKSYAERMSVLEDDPSVQKAVVKALPALPQAMPGILEKALAATASLPKPRDVASLSDAERDKVAQLLGVDPSSLKKKAPGAS